MTLRIKICGITNLKDARCAVDSGADLLGFIQYPPSPRYITPEDAGEIISQLPPGTETVGVFVNETAETITAAASAGGFTTIQLHGNEHPAILDQLHGFNVIKALGIQSESDLAKSEGWESVPLLIDTPCPEHGGSGRVGNWQLAAAVARKHRVYLAGGLTPDNVAEAVAEVSPFGIDVSSGVETSKGIKDHEKVREFIRNARAGDV